MNETKKSKKSDAEIIADSILRELNKSARGIIDLSPNAQIWLVKKMG